MSFVPKLNIWIEHRTRGALDHYYYFPLLFCVHHGQLLFSSSWRGWSTQLNTLTLWEATASMVRRSSSVMPTTLKNFLVWTLVNGRPLDCTSWDYQRIFDRSTRNCGRRLLLPGTSCQCSPNMLPINTHLIPIWVTAECKSSIHSSEVHIYFS